MESCAGFHARVSLPFDDSLEDSDVARAVVVGEIDIERHPDQLPALVGEVLEALKELPRVQSRVDSPQVPDVDGMLDRSHRPP